MARYRLGSRCREVGEWDEVDTKSESPMEVLCCGLCAAFSIVALSRSLIAPGYFL